MICAAMAFSFWVTAEPPVSGAQLVIAAEVEGDEWRIEA
jgi:hypothetical protein